VNEHLLELCDHSLRLSSRDGPVISAPGFASIADDAVLYGDEARSRYRLHPRDSFNQFWSQLSLEPLSNPNRHFRHQADIAFGQLSAFTREHAADSEVLFALPGHFSRDQIALFLGLISHCPVQPVALADLAVLSAASVLNKPEGTVLDMQLHQSVLTTVKMQNGLVMRQGVQKIPGAGLLALQEAWIALITDAFISQCRFNPRHTAATEQFMYDMLHTWITMSHENNEVRPEINHKGTLYQATVLRSDFEQKARSVFSRIDRELPDLKNAQLLIPETVSSLPGSRLWLPGHDIIQAESVQSHAWKIADWLREHSRGNVFLIDIPSAIGKAVETVNVPDNRHLLVGHRSFALPAGGEVNVGTDLAGDAGIPHPFTLDCGEAITITACPAELMVNGKSATPGQIINPGDQLGFEESQLTLTVIEVG
jgi:hypothetical protein